MKRVVRKAFLNFEKEEEFLNEMSAKGWALIDYSWCKYVFEDAPKGEYIYRIELLEKPVEHPESQNYIEFMEETGVELVDTYNRWVYFRKKASDGAFDIYSDIDSRIRHYRRIRVLFSAILGLNLFMGALSVFFGSLASAVGQPEFNTYVSILSFSVVALLLIFLVLPLTRKIDALEKEKAIRE